MESSEKQNKYRELARQQKYESFKIKDGEEIYWTGQFKYVEMGRDEDDQPIYKRKRVFKKVSKRFRMLSQEQNEEILQCFNLFDRDGNGSIDTKELKDAMKALGIFLKKQELKEYMSKMDKDGSGSVEQVEFICLMTEVLNKRNVREEMKKVFHCYDNDDDGKISALNLY